VLALVDMEPRRVTTPELAVTCDAEVAARHTRTGRDYILRGESWDLGKEGKEEGTNDLYRVNTINKHKNLAIAC